MKYAIEVIGYGKRRGYAIKQVFEYGTNPTDGKRYKTEEAARAAADKMGVKIEGVGDLWQIAEYGEARK